MLNSTRSILKKDMVSLTEPFILKQLQKNEYDLLSVQALSLLTWQRFDLAFKLFYLETVGVNKELAEEIYKEDIKSQTLGGFSEYGDDEKNNFDNYITEFDKIFTSIRDFGFDSSRTLIPLSKNNSIVNAAHRVASAIYLKKNVDCVHLELDDFICDYNYFYQRNVPVKNLDIAANKFIEYSDDIYIAFLWPSMNRDSKDLESQIPNVVYRKEISLTPRGAYNLIVQLYKGMEWVGTREDGYVGAKQKLIECFKSFEPVTVLAFQAADLDEVRLIKSKVREIRDIGYSSIHITDTKEEAERISKLVFNKNGIHFLNYAEPYKYNATYKSLALFEKYLNRNGVDKSQVLIDGSVILSLYGLRKNEDVDYFILDNKTLENSSEFEAHDAELKYHGQLKKDLIYDPDFYFQYNGFKFVSFSQLYLMKKERGEEKDINDCNMMDAFLKGDLLKQFISKIKQYLFYFRIKIISKSQVLVMKGLKVIGLYVPVRWIYRKFK